MNHDFQRFKDKMEKFEVNSQKIINTNESFTDHEEIKTLMEKVIEAEVNIEKLFEFRDKERVSERL